MGREMKKLKLIGIFLLLGAAMTAQDTKYPLTEMQTLRLQVKQRDAQIAQQNVFIAQSNFAVAIKALREESEKVKFENKWPEDLQFVPEQLIFIDPVKSPIQNTVPLLPVPIDPTPATKKESLQ